MSPEPGSRNPGDIVALRYVTTDGRIEMCWPCRVVVDGPELVALFIAAGSSYRAGPKKTAAEKRVASRSQLPPDTYVWRKDTLRLMLPERHHSVLLFWDGLGSDRRFTKYFVNMEEPFRRTPVGIDTQDHTIDVDVAPNLAWRWRDEEELRNHVKYGFYTEALAAAARAEGERAIAAIERGDHPCLDSWSQWSPDHRWKTPEIPAGWDTTPVTFWAERPWAYGVPA
jgi:predicted RNA-binding protein associated with RNAse of E/G family